MKDRFSTIDKARSDMKKFGMFLLFVLAIFGFTWIVMLLWNWLVPAIIGWSAITYWQAMGLLILSKILFGFGGGKGSGNHRHRRRRWHKSWMHHMAQMSPEERQRMCREWYDERSRKTEDTSDDAATVQPDA